MTALEIMKVFFTSGNSVPVERAMITRELFEEVESEYKTLLHQRDLLGQSIAEAAFKAGIYNGQVPLDGPQLLMLVDDMAQCIVENIDCDNG